MKTLQDPGFTIAQAADQLEVTRQYLYKLMSEGRLVARPFPKTEWRMTQADIDELRERLWGGER